MLHRTEVRQQTLCGLDDQVEAIANGCVIQHGNITGREPVDLRVDLRPTLTQSCCACVTVGLRVIDEIA